MKKLVIVQHKPTQFDAPFYELVSQRKAFDLHVFYTASFGNPLRQVDPEIGRSPEWDNLRPHGYPCTHLSAQQAADLRAVSRLILKENPDLVILCGYLPLLHARLALLLRRRGVRIGLRSDNTLRHSNFNGIKGLIKRAVLPVLIRQYDTWHPVGSLALEYLKTMAKTDRPVYYFPYSVDIDWFESRAEACRKNRDHIRKQLGFEHGDFIVLGIMKWNEREDPLTLIRAVTKASKINRTVKLILLGDGTLRGSVEKAIADVGGSVHTPGYLPYSQLPKYYAISDLFVHPAIGEPWGVSVNESMACGVGVVAAEGVGSAKDLIIPGETGFVFPDGDSDVLSEFILLLSNDPAQLAALGKMARQHVQKWGYERTISEMEAALNHGRK